MISKKNRQDDQSFEVHSYSSQSVIGNYTVITYKDRIRFIEMVCIEKVQIIEAAKQLNIKISTAKYILRSFRKESKVLLKNQGFDFQKSKYEEEIKQLKQRIEAVNKQKLKKKSKKTKKDKTTSNQEKKLEKVETIKQQAQIMDENKNKLMPQPIIDNPQFNYNFGHNADLIYYFIYPFWVNLPMQ